MKALEIFMEPETLSEAPMPQTQGSTLYWHGTNNTSGQAVLRNGFTIGAERVRGAGYIPPVVAGTYLTPQFTAALQFAYRDNRQRYGWLFAVPGSALTDVEVDEDEIGLAVRAVYQKQELPGRRPTAGELLHAPVSLIWHNPDFAARLLMLAEHLPDELKAHLRAYHQHNAKWFSDAGRLIGPRLTPEMVAVMIDAGCHVAQTEAIVPAHAWRFNPKNGAELHNASLRVGPDEALRQFAEKMR